jgi:hypothetical protein
MQHAHRAEKLNGNTSTQVENTSVSNFNGDIWRMEARNGVGIRNSTVTYGNGQLGGGQEHDSGEKLLASGEGVIHHAGSRHSGRG